MPTANERKALWFLAFVALSGSGVRLWRANMPQATATEAAALERQLKRVDSVRDVRQRAAAARRRVLRPDGAAAQAPVDLDRASAAEIEALPGIGPTLANRIVAARDSGGPFGAVEGLCEVRGIGPALVERLRPLVTFTGPRRHVSAACGEASKKPRKTRGARTPQSR